MAATGELVELVPRYTGIYIFLSYLVSFIGSWTTIEMLLKRTGMTGVWNIALLLGAGIAFGSTATFGMHFVGNQSVTLRFAPPWEGTGVPLSYNAGFTILSLVVSCVSMVLAFSFIGLRLRQPAWRTRGEDLETPLGEPEVAYDLDTKADLDSPVTEARSQQIQRAPTSSPPRSADEAARRKDKNRAADRDDDEEDDERDEFGVGAAKVSRAGVLKIVVAGVVCGGGIAAMHYIGQVSIDSVAKVTNDWYTVFLSVIIAMICVTVGLYILFVVFRPKLQHSWIKRILVAAILAVGVTLMHFVALLGTHYWVRPNADLRTGSDSTTKKIIIAIICCVAPICCICLLVFAYIGQQRALRLRAARHRVILSSAIFDHHGLMLVDPETGLLPFTRIYPTPIADETEEKLNWRSLLRFDDRLRLDAAKLRLQRSDPAFVAFLRLSWKWRLPKGDSGEDTATPTYRGSIAFSDFASHPSQAADRGRSKKVTPIHDLTDPESSGLVRSLASFQLAGEEIAEAVTGTGDPKVLGVLYDSILKIGHYEVSSKSSGDKFVVSQGQMLLLTRRLRTVAEREALLARGFVFAEPGAVARVTANAYAVPEERVFEYFRDAYHFARNGLTKRYERGRLYGGLLMLQALPGEGLQILADERQHHALPMIELATLVDPRLDIDQLDAGRLPYTTLEEVVEGVDEIALNTLLDLSNRPTSSLRHAAQLRNLLVDVVRPHLEQLLGQDVLDFVLPRLEVAPTIVPLTSRPGPTYSADGVAKDSYCVCLKIIVPSSVKLPSAKLAWLPFPLFQAQNDCVTRASGAGTIARRGTRAAFGAVSDDLNSSDPTANSAASDFLGDRQGSAGDASSDGGLPFPTSTAAPFVSRSVAPARRPSPVAGGTAGSARSGAPDATRPPSRDTSDRGDDLLDSLEDQVGSSSAARPTSSAGPSSTYAGVPPFSSDWIVDLVRVTASRPGQNRWDYQQSSYRRS